MEPYRGVRVGRRWPWRSRGEEEEPGKPLTFPCMHACMRARHARAPRNGILFSGFSKNKW